MKYIHVYIYIYIYIYIYLSIYYTIKSYNLNAKFIFPFNAEINYKSLI